jgi:hypothetical protein
MHKKLTKIFWGFLLIAAGGIALAQTQGLLTNDVNPTIWTTIFAVISLVSLVFYFLNGIQNWSLLFPAGIFGALAFIITAATTNTNNPAMSAPLFVGLGLPFVVAYSLDHNKNWWALIPADVMTFLTFVLLVVENLGGEIIGSALFFILAAAFGSVYFTRRFLWAAIVAYGMFVLGFIPLIAMSSHSELAGILMMFAIALPFFVIYLRLPYEKYWAIIPAGILSTAGFLSAVILLSGLPGPGYANRIPNSLMYLGIAATFTVVWLRHHKRWGLFFTALALFAATANLFIGGLERSWPMLLLAAGGYLLYTSLRRQTVNQ